MIGHVKQYNEDRGAEDPSRCVVVPCRIFCRRFAETPCYAAAMALKPQSRLSGREGWAAPWHWSSARRISHQRDRFRGTAFSRRKARELAKRVHAIAATTQAQPSRPIWSGSACPIARLRGLRTALAQATDWKGKIVFHSSGALPSDELHALRRRGQPWLRCIP